MVADKDLSPLPGLIKCNILSGGLRPRLLSFHPSGARPAHSATEFRDRYWLRLRGNQQAHRAVNLRMETLAGTGTRAGKGPAHGPELC